MSSRIRRFRTVIRVFVSSFCPTASAASAYLSWSSSSSSLLPKSSSRPSPFSFPAFATRRTAARSVVVRLSISSSRSFCRAASTASYSSYTRLCSAGSYPFHLSRFASYPVATSCTTSSAAMSRFVNLAPFFRGRSRQSCRLCVIAPQFSHAPLRYFFAAGPAFAPRSYQLSSLSAERSYSGMR